MIKHLLVAVALAVYLALAISSGEQISRQEPSVGPSETGKSIARRSSGSKAKTEDELGGLARLRAFERMKAMPVFPGFDRAWQSIGPRPTVVLQSAISGGPPIASGRVTS